MLAEDTTKINETTSALKELFWRRGYEKASIEDVVKATGMNRYALYNAYGGKRELFLAALNDYYLERKNIFVTNLEDPETAPLDAIRRVFEFAILAMAERGAGCLMCNVANDLGPRDPVISAQIESYHEEIRWAYTEALSRAESRGELNTNITPDAAAQLLLAVKLGLGVHAKAGASGEAMLNILDTTLQSLSREKQQ